MLKYEAIAHDIQKSIEDGTLKPGEKLPTVVELCDVYGVSKITVKRAMEWLTEIGLIISKRGSGTYVKTSTPMFSDPLSMGVNDRARGFTAEHADSGCTVTSDVHDFQIVNPDEQVARRLGITCEDFTYYICRTRLVDGLPIVIERTYMPIDLIPGFKRKHLYGSIYSYINDQLGLKISSFHRAIRAVPASEEDAPRLAIEAGEPLLEFEQIGYLDDGEPFEYSISRNVGSRYTLHNITLN